MVSNNLISPNAESTNLSVKSSFSRICLASVLHSNSAQKSLNLIPMSRQQRSLKWPRLLRQRPCVKKSWKSKRKSRISKWVARKRLSSQILLRQITLRLKAKTNATSLFSQTSTSRLRNSHLHQETLSPKPRLLKRNRSSTFKTTKASL